MSAKVIMTEEEIVSYLKKSSLVNVLVEGPDDVMIYNWIEEKIGKMQVKILPCGGRTTLLRLYDRREEFKNKSVVFVADKDMWVFAGVPVEYDDIIFTSGYSIENDPYSGSKDVLTTLFSREEASDFDLIVQNLVPWYCYEVSNFKKGQNYILKVNLNKVIPEGGVELCQRFMKARNFDYSKPSEELQVAVTENDFLRLRGKFLIDAAVRQLSSKRKKSKSKFSRENVLEMCLKMGDNTHINRVKNEILQKIEIV